MRLIDADELRGRWLSNGLNEPVYNTNDILDSIDDAATIAPVKHGRWILNTDNFTPAKRCSCCGYNKPIAAGENITQEPENFCPACGAKMDADDSHQSEGDA